MLIAKLSFVQRTCTQALFHGKKNMTLVKCVRSHVVHVPFACEMHAFTLGLTGTSFFFNPHIMNVLIKCYHLML